MTDLSTWKRKEKGLLNYQSNWQIVTYISVIKQFKANSMKIVDLILTNV